MRGFPHFQNDILRRLVKFYIQKYLSRRLFDCRTVEYFTISFRCRWWYLHSNNMLIPLNGSIDCPFYILFHIYIYSFICALDDISWKLIFYWLCVQSCIILSTITIAQYFTSEFSEHRIIVKRIGTKEFHVWKLPVFNCNLYIYILLFSFIR